jgi:hypothetical protein
MWGPEHSRGFTQQLLDVSRSFLYPGNARDLKEATMQTNTRLREALDQIAAMRFVSISSLLRRHHHEDEARKIDELIAAYDEHTQRCSVQPNHGHVRDSG